MSSHEDPKVKDRFLKWLNSKYGKYGEVKGLRETYQDFLGINFNFCNNKHLILDMRKYVKNQPQTIYLTMAKDQDH